MAATAPKAAWPRGDRAAKPVRGRSSSEAQEATPFERRQNAGGAPARVVLRAGARPKLRRVGWRRGRAVVSFAQATPREDLTAFGQTFKKGDCRQVDGVEGTEAPCSRIGRHLEDGRRRLSGETKIGSGERKLQRLTAVGAAGERM